MNKKSVVAASLGFVSLFFCVSAAAELKPFYEESADAWHCGYKNDAGKIVVPIKKYEVCGRFSDGMAYVGKSVPIMIDGYERYNYLQGFIDQTGHLVIPVEHEVSDSGDQIGYRNFSEGLVAVLRNEKYGYMNKQRELVVPYRYKYANEFKEGLAIVSQNDKFGAINNMGKTIIPLKFDYLGNYSEGLAVYSEKNHWNDDYSYGYIDKKGDVSIKASWSEACEFSEGLAAVRVNDYDSGKWGIIDKTGNFIVKPEYDAPNIESWSDEHYDDCYYKKSKINMYKYTDASNREESSITRYTLNRQGNVVGKKFYSNWDSLVKEFIENDGL